MVQRASLKKHLTKCPMSLVDCKYKDAGCLAKVRRKDTSSHYSHNISEHLEMAHSAFLRLSDKSQRERDCLAAKVESLKQKLAYAEAELFSKESTLVSFQQKKDGEIKGYATQIHSMETKLKAMDSQVQEHVKSINMLQQKLTTQAEELSIQQSSVKSLQSRLKEQHSEKTTYVAQIQSLQTQLRAQKCEAQALADTWQQERSLHAATMQKSIDEKNQEIKSLQRDRTVTAQTVRDQKEKIESLKNEVTHKDSKLVTLSQHYECTVSELEAEICELQQHFACTVTELEAKIGELQKSLKMKDTFISSLDMMLQRRLEEVRTLEKSVALREEQLHAQAASIQQLQVKYGIKDQPPQDCNVM